MIPRRRSLALFDLPDRSRAVAAAVLALAPGACLPRLASAQAHGRPGHALDYGEPKDTAIVMDASTGEILYAERADSPRYPASVTKVMTFTWPLRRLPQAGST